MSIQEARHAARDNVVNALKGLMIDTEGEYVEMVGLCQHTLMLTQGVPGMPKDAQVQVLDHFITDLDKVLDGADERIASIKVAMATAIEHFGDGVVDSLKAARANAVEAKELAIARDFEAHQEEKAKLREEADVIAFSEQIDAVSETGELPEKVSPEGVIAVTVDPETGETTVQQFDSLGEAFKATDEDDDEDNSKE